MKFDRRLGSSTVESALKFDRCDNLNIRSFGFETLRDLVVRRLTVLWFVEYTNENMQIYPLIHVLLEPLYWISALILGLHPANKRRRYKVTPSLIGWAQT